MRKRLEDTNDQRWEFDRKPLFGKTDYMSEICANILEILEALDHFKVFLGPELKAVTGDEQMDATAILDYFAPLKVWMDAQNKEMSKE